MSVNTKMEQPSPTEALPDILMRVVSELHDVAYLIERIEPQLLDLGGGAHHQRNLQRLDGRCRNRA
jgi:hypothetical protein